MFSGNTSCIIVSLSCIYGALP